MSSQRSYNDLTEETSSESAVFHSACTLPTAVRFARRDLMFVLGFDRKKGIRMPPSPAGLNDSSVEFIVPAALSRVARERVYPFMDRKDSKFERRLSAITVWRSEARAGRISCGRHRAHRSSWLTGAVNSRVRGTEHRCLLERRLYIVFFFAISHQLHDSYKKDRG